MTNDPSNTLFQVFDFGIHSFLGISDFVISDEGGTR